MGDWRSTGAAWGIVLAALGRDAKPPRQATHRRGIHAGAQHKRSGVAPRSNISQHKKTLRQTSEFPKASEVCLRTKEANLHTAIVTDSTSDIPAPLREKYNIFQIPAILVIEGEATMDGVGISRNEFYTRLPEMSTTPTTAAPSVGDFQTLYHDLFEKGFTKILSIHASSKLSGIFNAARIAAQEFKEKINAFVFEKISVK